MMSSGETAEYSAAAPKGNAEALRQKGPGPDDTPKRPDTSGHRRCNLPRMGRGISQVRIRGRKATALRPFLLPENGTNLKEELIK